MKAEYFETLQAGRRSSQFFLANADALGRDDAARLRATIDPLVAQLATFEAEQESSISGGIGHTAYLETLRAEMYETYLNNIRTIAEVELRDTPEFPALVMWSRVADSEFVTKVNTLIGGAEKHQDVLIEFGLRDDFIAGLRAALAELLAATDARGRLNSRRNASTKGIETAEAALRGQLKVLDGLLKPLTKNKPSLQADWKASRKIHKRPVTPLSTGSLNMGDGAESPSAKPPAPPVESPDGTESP